MEYEELIEKRLELEKAYKEQHPDLDDNRLFPRDWYSINDMELRNRILEEAIEKKVTLYESELMLKAHDNMLNQRISGNVKAEVEKLVNKYK